MSHCVFKSLPFEEGFAFDYSSCLPMLITASYP